MINNILSLGGRRRTQTSGPSTRPGLQLPRPADLSRWSTPDVPNSAWCSSNFQLGAGMVLIQQNTHKIVVVYDTQEKYWFFPRGRKDRGESLEQAALREAYEESGYRAEFLPMYHSTMAPIAPNSGGSRLAPHTEPIFVTLMSWLARKHREGGEYIISWYVGQIPEDAVRETNTGMPDEKNYVSYLLGIDDAIPRLCMQERSVLEYVWHEYCQTLEWRHRLSIQQRDKERAVYSTPSSQDLEWLDESESDGEVQPVTIRTRNITF